MKYKLLFITLLVGGIGWGQTTLPLTRTIWNSVPTGWTDSAGSAYTTSFACSGNNGSKFDASNQYLIVNFNSVPDKLSFVVKSNNASSTSVLLVQESENGSSWTTVVSLTGNSGLPSTCTTRGYYDLLCSTRYVKWTFTKGTSNMTMDDVSITAKTILSTTYVNNSWDNCIPSSTIDAVINGDLTTSTDLVCKDLTINSGKTLTIAAGTTLSVSGNLVNNGSIIFKSNNTSTGRFGSFTGTITGSGSVTAERYIDGKRAYRLLAPGVTTSSSIANNWQQQVFITGSTTGANGFDATATGNPSMYTYENSGWTPISNTNVLALNTTKGYRILIRGDRTPSILTNPSNGNMNTPVTLATTGTMTTGDVTYTTLSDQDYTLVANPYISPINWATVTKSGVSDTYYAWDPNLGTGNQRGRYVSCDTAGVTSIISGNGSPTSDVDQYIQPGQAFFIQKATSGVNGSITVKETDKAAVFTDIFRTSSSSSADNGINGKLGINLYESSAYSIGDYPIDGAVAVSGATFDTYSSNDDINKIMSHGEQVAFVRDNVQLGVEKVNIPQINDELSIASLNLLSNKSYIWNIVLQDDFSNESVYLYDAFTQNYHPLNFSSTTVVPFETTGDGSSTNINRFKIVFQNSALNTSNFEYPIGLHPNPSQGATGFYLSNMTANAKVALFTLLGQSVPVVTVLNGNTLQVLPKNSLSQGVYLVQVTSPEGLIKQVKWIVE